MFLGDSLRCIKAVEKFLVASSVPGLEMESCVYNDNFGSSTARNGSPPIEALLNTSRIQDQVGSPSIQPEESDVRDMAKVLLPFLTSNTYERLDSSSGAHTVMNLLLLPRLGSNLSVEKFFFGRCSYSLLCTRLR